MRGPDYYEDINFIKDDLGLSMAINPEFSAATACYHLIRTPGAVDLDPFAKGRAQIITMDLPMDSCWAGKQLMEVAKTSPVPVSYTHLALVGDSYNPFLYFRF